MYTRDLFETPIHPNAYIFFFLSFPFLLVCMHSFFLSFLCLVACCGRLSVCVAAIIFIDEIDSVGAKRSTSFGNSERDNTLNQLLVEMDGFTPDQTVVVLAGTNRDDLLDDALKRPGRFDRIIQIKRPDVKERKEIFKVHLKPLKLSTSIDPSALAGRMAALTPGFVGADIANLCNEAAIQAARRRSKLGVEQQDFETATERTIAGLPSSMKDLLSPQQRRAIAFHECGHAIAGWFLQHG
ncbi:atp-dependent metallopeptidase subfamily protein, partial [Cystoisospora suis]